MCQNDHSVSLSTALPARICFPPEWGKVQSSIAETAPILSCHPSPLLCKQQSTKTTSLLSGPPLLVSFQAPLASSQIPFRRTWLSTAPDILGCPTCCQTAETEIHRAGFSSWRWIYSEKGTLNYLVVLNQLKWMTSKSFYLHMQSLNLNLNLNEHWVYCLSYFKQDADIWFSVSSCYFNRSTKIPIGCWNQAKCLLVHY